MPENATIPDLIEELRWRGLLHQCTDEAGLREHLASGERRIYAGFDPTATSLTIGNLVPIMLLAHVKRSGHEAVVVMGGGTGLIGDPSGKTAERQLNTPETVAENVLAQRPIFDSVLGRVDGPAHRVLNNLDWLGGLSYIDALRDIGKHFSVNMMMQKESVKSRLESREQGISYTEFSYMILQAYDFLCLHSQGLRVDPVSGELLDFRTGASGPVTVQIGGSDQYGNIVAGLDLISKDYTHYVSRHVWRFRDVAATEHDMTRDPWASVLPTMLSFGELSRDHERQLAQICDAVENSSSRVREAWRILTSSLARIEKLVMPGFSFGLTAPLVTKSDGTKFGKTESGAVWLTADRTSPYAYYQFWLNATDDDARNWIKIFTFLDQPTVTDLIQRHDANPGARELQRALAREATAILHGSDAMERAEAAAKALFSGELAGLDEATLNEVFADVPSSEHLRSSLEGDGVDPVVLLKDTNLASSNREAREFLTAGSVSVNGEKITLDTRLTPSHLLHGSIMAIRRGKKNWHLARWVG